MPIGLEAPQAATNPFDVLDGKPTRPSTGFGKYGCRPLEYGAPTVLPEQPKPLGVTPQRPRRHNGIRRQAAPLP